MDGQNRNIALVVNPTKQNEKARAICEQLTTLLASKGILHTVFLKKWPPCFSSFSEAWIIGGDGTVNKFINAYPDLEIPLAVFAGGTGNDFCWMLYGDLHVKQQAELVLNAAPKKVDAGMCNGILFLNGVGIGFDGAIVKDLIGKRKMAGKTSYLISILKQIIGYKEKHCFIETKEEPIERDCFMISVANAKRYGGGFMVAPRSSLTDGLLDLSIVEKISPLKRIRYLPRIEKGEHLNLPFIQYLQVPSVKIHFSEPQHAHLDGEYLLASEFAVSLSPGRFSFLY